MKSGLTSVTFRDLEPEQIIQLAADAGLDGIEWGGDIHVPPGDFDRAQAIGKATRDAGLEVLSYGSYYRAGAEEDGIEILETASALGAPHVRIWAGAVNAPDMTEENWTALAAQIRQFCRDAERYGIGVSTEYHNNTATSNIGSTIRLLDMIPNENFFSYFQPDNRCTDAENLENLKKILPRVSNLHVFHWKSWTERFALSEGEKAWLPYLQAYAEKQDGACIMEFVKDDSPQQFMEDAATLNQWIATL